MNATPARSSARAAPVLALALLASGCFKSYVAVSFRPPPVPDAPAEVHQTPRLLELGPAPRTIAVRAPASCRSESSAVAEGSGVAARGRTILEARCDVFLGELERALSGVHRVVSWRDLAEAERAAGGLPHVAARRAGADAVLLVVDLAVAPVLVSDLRGPGVELADAYPDGSRRGKAVLSARAEDTIRSLVEVHFRDGGLAGVSAGLELELLASASGEPLWTYQRRVVADLEGARDSKMLLRGRSRTWRPVEPRGKPRAAAAGEEDVVRARLRDLARTLAQDAIERLAAAGRVASAGSSR